jgi:putative membrane protein insertion efficiency factor
MPRLSGISSARSNRLSCVKGAFLNMVIENANRFREKRQRTGAVQDASRSREPSVTAVRESSGVFAAILVALVRLYQSLLSPAMRFLLGTSGACRYTPTCSCYAIEAFKRHGAFRGLRLTTRRLLRCHPWGSAGHDPVPHNFGGER